MLTAVMNVLMAALFGSVAVASLIAVGLSLWGLRPHGQDDRRCGYQPTTMNWRLTANRKAGSRFSADESWR